MNITKIATYRLQLQPDFGFDQVCEVVEYLKQLGISHIYTSPYLQAAEGSTHGYDVVDPSHVNVELGGPTAHEKMCKLLQKEKLGHVIDVVPNHMAITGQQNPWWWDVLENGPSSRYATYFDVDWENTEDRWQNKILLPILGDHYGRVLEDQQLRLVHQSGNFALHYFEHAFPVDPSSLSSILYRAAERVGSDTLAFLAESYARMPRPSLAANRDDIERRHRDKAVLHLMLQQHLRESPEFSTAIDSEVKSINSNADALDKLIEEQNYRLAYWRTASKDLGYRRFFDIADLAGMRIEDEKVFNDTHRLLLSWVDKGWVQGLRIDHPDGLRDPKRYFERLRSMCPDNWIIVEKILQPGEVLREDWPIEGTTGYEFLNMCMQTLVKPSGEQPLTQFFQEFTGQEQDFEKIIDQCKKQVLDDLLQSELNRLTTLFVNICEQHRRYRDFSRSDLFEALSAVAQCFTVYRTYINPRDEHLNSQDVLYVKQAITQAKLQNENLDDELLEFLKEILCLQVPGDLEKELAARFQQLTGPVMAKGIEDTTFYRFNRLTALNEVGGEPDQFGISLQRFHQFSAYIHSSRPTTMLCSTTHDTKRSEDVRARLLVLAELPEKWRLNVLNWHEINQKNQKSTIPEDVEYLFYQAIVGAWPIGQARILAYMQKASREAKLHTTWTNLDEQFEQSLELFVEAAMGNRQFCDSVNEFVESIKIPGYQNSLAQTLIKLTAPGIPDIYQGNELWDFSLVDPDNRRPVDFDHRQQLVRSLPTTSLSHMLEDIDSGVAKLWLTQSVLRTRAKYPDAFSPTGHYQALFAQGEFSDHIIAFSRGNAVISIAPRYPLSRPEGWRDTFITLPPGKWQNVLTSESLTGSDQSVSTLLKHFPVALLIKEASE